MLKETPVLVGLRACVELWSHCGAVGPAFIDEYGNDVITMEIADTTIAGYYSISSLNCAP